MNRPLRTACVLSIASLVLLLATWTVRGTGDAASTKSDVAKLAKDAQTKSWDDLLKESDPVAQKNKLGSLKTLFKLRARGGLGFGEQPSTSGDGIEAKIINLSRRVAATEFKNDKALLQMAQVTAAVAAATYHLPDATIKDKEADIKQWRQWSRDMHEASLEVIKAVEAKDAKQLKSAATKLNKSCHECHEKYRDGA